MIPDFAGRIRRINEARAAASRSGDPGDPPQILCEGCGIVSDFCECPKCPDEKCGKRAADCEKFVCVHDKHESNCCDRRSRQ